MKASLPSYCCRCVACYFYKHSPSYFFCFCLMKLVIWLENLTELALAAGRLVMSLPWSRRRRRPERASGRKRERHVVAKFVWQSDSRSPLDRLEIRRGMPGLSVIVISAELNWTGFYEFQLSADPVAAMGSMGAIDGTDLLHSLAKVVIVNRSLAQLVIVSPSPG